MYDTYSTTITKSDKDSHFTGSLIQDAGEEENIGFHADWVTANVNLVNIENVNIQSDQPLDWELAFFKNDTQADTDLDTDSFITSIKFYGSEAKQIAATGQYYYSPNPAISTFIYNDGDGTNEFHLMLINRSTESKLEGSSGEVVVTISCAPVN